MAPSKKRQKATPEQPKTGVRRAKAIPTQTPKTPSNITKPSKSSLTEARKLTKSQEIEEVEQLSIAQALRRERSPDAPKTRGYGALKKSMVTRRRASISPAPKLKKPKKIEDPQIGNVEYLESWENLRVKIPGIEEVDLVTHTKNWQTIIQINLGVIGYLYQKVNNKSVAKANTAMELGLRELEIDLSKREADFKKSLNDKFKEFAKQKGKNLLAAFVIVILENESRLEYKIIDISSKNNLVNFLDTTSEKTEALCVIDNAPANAQRDFHTETAVCVDIPEIIKKSLDDLGYKDRKSVKKVYVYMDSTKSCCNSCVKKMQQTQEIHNDLPLSFIVNWHTKFEGVVASEYERREDANFDTSIQNDEELTDNEAQGTASLPTTPIKQQRANTLERVTPSRTIRAVAKKQDSKNELSTLSLFSPVYISGSSETEGNKKIQELFNHHRHKIEKMVQSLVSKFLISNQQTTMSSALQQSQLGRIN